MHVCDSKLPNSSVSYVYIFRFWGDIAENRFRLIDIDVTFPWICLSVTFVHCAETADDIDTISSAYTIAPCLFQVVEIWLTSVNLFLPKFCHKVTNLC